MEAIVGGPGLRTGTARSPNAPRADRRAVPGTRKRLKIVVRGAVQGVGFRPFVYRVATELNLSGHVSNTAQGVFIEVEGTHDVLEQFQRRIETKKPPRAIVQSVQSSFLDVIGYNSFEIRQSEEHGSKAAFILPDLATCVDCLAEILDPNNRRFRYPFTNCTNCGPRFSIIEALPYDRSNTSMKKFAMCDACEHEYHNPLDRRFHAQPNACPECGPQLELWECSDPAAGPLSKRRHIRAIQNEALLAAATAVRDGKILALKGVGGFQLIVDARNQAAVLRLRERKHRDEKPFALMYPSLDAIKVDCDVSDLEQRLLVSSEAPIALLRKQSAVGDGQLAISIAPRNPNLGVMLPYSPLHHLIMRELDFPIVATSGNLSDEPICIDEQEALRRLNGIADLFLVHDRPIVRHVDDSVVRVMCGRELVLRRARGYAPLPVAGRPRQTPTRGVSQLQRIAKANGQAFKRPIILAVGAHLKNTIALQIDSNIFIGQHIGDLETKEAYAAFRRTCADLPRLYDANIDVIACDMHPEYLSTKDSDVLASRAGRPLPAVDGAYRVTRPAKIPVQHHWAHMLACMAENQIEPPALGVVWDGTGYGLDRTIWGGEFLRANNHGTFERVAHFRQFRLPGGDRAIKEPRRSALGLLYEIFGEHAWDFLTADFSEKEKSLLGQMLAKQINAPLTSSVGRLFDALASLVGLRQRANFEGQAAMELEFARRLDVRDAYPFRIEQARTMKVDWEPMIRELLADMGRKESRGVISAKFHNALAEMSVVVAKQIGEQQVVLTGGCFQNRYLTERTVERLREENFTPYWHQRIPPNDGGIALGQAIAAGWRC